MSTNEDMEKFVLAPTVTNVNKANLQHLHLGCINQNHK